MKSSEKGMNIPETSRVTNMDKYEREKIMATLGDAEHLVAVIKNYLATVDYCNENGIKLSKRKSLEDIRRPGTPVGPAGTLLIDLAILFESGMYDMSKNINISHKDELEKRMEKE